MTDLLVQEGSGLNAVFYNNLVGEIIFLAAWALYAIATAQRRPGIHLWSVVRKANSAILRIVIFLQLSKHFQ